MKQHALVFERKDGYWNITSGSTLLASGYFLDGELNVTEQHCPEPVTRSLLTLLEHFKTTDPIIK